MDVSASPMYLPQLTDILDRQVLCLAPDTPMLQVLAQLSQRSKQACSLEDDQFALTGLLPIHCAIAVDEQRRPLGIFTERDVVRHIATGDLLGDRTLGEMMTPEPIVLAARDYSDIFGVIELMQRHQIRHLPVVNGANQLQGIITPESLRWVLQPVNLLRMRTLAEIMIRDVVTATSDTTVLQVAQLLAQERISCVVMTRAIADRLEPIGLITEGDVLQCQVLELPLAQLPVDQVMSTPLLTLTAEQTLWDAHSLMKTKRVRRVVIVDAQGLLEGIVTQTSILQPLSSVDLYSIVQVLQHKITHLESEKRAILEQRTTELEAQVKARTVELQTQTQRSQEASQRERVLADIARNIRQSLKLPEILNTTVQDVRSLLEVDRVIVVRFDPDWQAEVVAESVAPTYRSLIGSTVYDPCFAPDWVDPYLKGRIRAVDDIYQANMADCHIELLEGIQVRAKILVPIVLQTTESRGEEPTKRLWGLLSVNQCSAPRHWQPFEAELLERLATQVAIAIQQSELYQQSQAELRERQRTETALRNLVTGTAAVTGEDFFPALVHHLAAALGIRVAIVTSYEQDRLQVLGYWADGECRTPCVPPTEDSPCYRTLQEHHYCCQQLTQAYPHFQDYCPFVPESYLGVALLNSNKEAIGTLCIVDDRPLTDIEQSEAILRVFAARAAAELERQWATQNLQTLNQTLESWVIQRTADLQQSLKALSDVKYALDQSAIIAITDAEGIITEVNEKFCEISEYSRVELLGQTHALIKSDYHPPEFFEQLWQTIKRGDVWRGEIKNRAKGGRDYWVQTTIVPFLDEQGRPLQYLAIRTDITEQKQAEEAIAQLLEQEKELSELKSRFISTASHEFRTPLALISSSAGILQDYGDRLTDPKKAKHLQRIQGAVRQMTQLLEDVLTVNRAAAEQLPFKPEPMDLIAFCEQLHDEFAQSHPQRIHWQPPVSPDPAMIQADPKLLRQMLSNLLSNALKYSPSEEPIDWQLTYHPATYVFLVRDRGIGIPAADQERLFDSFHRAENVGTIQGTGLGLAIVKKCVDLHHGKITIDSMEQVGTTVTVELPLTVGGNKLS